MVKKILIISLLIYLSSCYRDSYPYDSSKLTFKGKIEFSDKIKFGGYFLCENGSNNIGIRYFFEDGYCSNHGDDVKVLNTNCPSVDIIRLVPYHWGVFNIVNDTITIQQVESWRSPFKKFSVMKERIAIINDSTLHLFEKVMSNKINVKMDVWYNFHPCSNKPASTNILMEEKKR
jgi:hypothetical protein